MKIIILINASEQLPREEPRQLETLRAETQLKRLSFGNKFLRNLLFLWGCSSVGRAPALQAGGQEFESLHLHESNEQSQNF